MHPKEPWEWTLIAVFAAAIAAMLGTAAYILLRDEWRFETEIVIPATPETLFPLFASARGRASWQFGILDVAPLTGEGDRPGDTALVYMTAEGRRWQIDETLLAYDPPRLWRVAQHGSGQHAVIEVEITAGEGTQSRIVWRETRRYQGLSGRLFSPVSLGENRKRVEASLTYLAARTAAPTP